MHTPPPPRRPDRRARPTLADLRSRLHAPAWQARVEALAGSTTDETDLRTRRLLTDRRSAPAARPDL